MGSKLNIPRKERREQITRSHIGVDLQGGPATHLKTKYIYRWHLEPILSEVGRKLNGLHA